MGLLEGLAMQFWAIFDPYIILTTFVSKRAAAKARIWP